MGCGVARDGFVGWLAEVVGFWSIPMVLGCVLFFIFMLSQTLQNIFRNIFWNATKNGKKK